jgi:acetyl-CoA carboxylase carboxyl transferase subunit beta
MPLFGKNRHKPVKNKKKEIPDGLWTKCPECGDIVYNSRLEENFKVCDKCDYHFTLTSRERIKLILDEGSFVEYDSALASLDPLEFQGPKTYVQKLNQDRKATGLESAAMTGEGLVNGRKAVCCVTDSRFIMGSMGSVVGEKITRAVETAVEKKLPVIIVSGSGGGARMYEGMFSLMQMAKTSAALSRHDREGLLFISVLTNPTMAGVMASFASLGDIIMAEPKALIGFTGPRVIEQTIKQKLPPGFQKSEFLLEHGLIDMIVHRSQMKGALTRLLKFLSK